MILSIKTINEIVKNLKMAINNQELVEVGFFSNTWFSTKNDWNEKYLNILSLVNDICDLHSKSEKEFSEDKDINFYKTDYKPTDRVINISNKIKELMELLPSHFIRASKVSASSINKSINLKKAYHSYGSRLLDEIRRRQVQIGLLGIDKKIEIEKSKNEEIEQRETSQKLSNILRAHEEYYPRLIRCLAEVKSDLIIGTSNNLIAVGIAKVLDESIGQLDSVIKDKPKIGKKKSPQLHIAGSEIKESHNNTSKDHDDQSENKDKKIKNSSIFNYGEIENIYNILKNVKFEKIKQKVWSLNESQKLWNSIVDLYEGQLNNLADDLNKYKEQCNKWDTNQKENKLYALFEIVENIMSKVSELDENESVDSSLICSKLFDKYYEKLSSASTRHDVIKANLEKEIKMIKVGGKSEEYVKFKTTGGLYKESLERIENKYQDEFKNSSKLLGTLRSIRKRINELPKLELANHVRSMCLQLPPLKKSIEAPVSSSKLKKSTGEASGVDHPAREDFNLENLGMDLKASFGLDNTCNGVSSRRKSGRLASSSQTLFQAQQPPITTNATADEDDEFKLIPAQAAVKGS